MDKTLSFPGHTYQVALPAKGLDDKELFTTIAHYNSLNDVEWRAGRCSGTIYCAEEDKNEMLSEVRGDLEKRVEWGSITGEGRVGLTRNELNFITLRQPMN